MAEVEIDGTIDLDWGAQGNAQIHQSLILLLSTRRGEQANQRAWGVDWTALDNYGPQAEAEFRYDVVKAVQRWFPNVKIKEIQFNPDHLTGRATPVITYEIEE